MGNVLNVLRWLLPPWQAPAVPEAEWLDVGQQAFLAAKTGDVKALQHLVQEVELQGGTPLPLVVDQGTGSTPLHEAMERGNTPCVLLLLRAGCSLTKGNHSGETPLHAACMCDRVESLAAALEVEKRVDVEVADMWGRTLLLKAMSYNSQHVVQFLLGRRVKLDVQDVFSFSVMHMAVTHNRPDLVHQLARQGADLNLLTSKGRSPLTQAILLLNPAMVRELLVLGASTCTPTTTTTTTLPTILAISEFVRRSEGGVVCPGSEEVLHLMLAAHGLPLRSSEPSVFQRVLHSTDLRRFLPLLYKMLVCSDSLRDDLRAVSAPDLWAGQGAAAPQTVVRLFDLARRSARSALMASGRNVVWAVKRLDSHVPPAVKGLLLLQDCDFKEFPLHSSG